jgi:DNA-binding CsgD family transcriptional regulator
VPPDDASWAKLFAAAFRESRNPMLLADSRRVVLDANGALVKMLGAPRRLIIGRPVYDWVAGGPIFTPAEWEIQLAKGSFTGTGEAVRPDGGRVGVQWGATVEVVTGQRRILLVVLSTSRWGARFRRPPADSRPPGGLSERELEVIRHVAVGRSGPEIAEELQIAHDTVRTHVRNAMTKMGARSRAHLVAKALGDGHALGA